MKYLFTIAFVLIFLGSYSQVEKSVEDKLSTAFNRINYWEQFESTDEKVNAYDSLEKANTLFEQQLLEYTSASYQTISYKFQLLQDAGLKIATSGDGLFRIYSWNTGTGGTMRIFKNVFQFKVGTRVFSKKLPQKEAGDAGCFYSQVNDILSGGEKFYITQSVAILSSGLSYHNVKIFSIDNSQLNDTAKLIKTKTGVKNQLGYEVDLTASANRDNELTGFTIDYDKKSRIISIPVILENSKLTAKKIRYQFKGKYFERL